MGRLPLRGVIAAFLLAAIGSGCLQPATGPTVRRRGVKRTYSVPKVDTQTSDAGFRFVTNHFDLQFDRALAGSNGFEMESERASRGKGAMLFLESQYQYLQEVFGIEAPTMIEVRVVPETADNEPPAFARFVPDRGVVEVVFGLEQFSAQAARAHEMTHAFTMLYGVPSWLDEGLAVLVEGELAGRAEWAKQRRSLNPIAPHVGPYNAIQLWREEGSDLPFGDVETYSYSYSIVAELRDRYGDVFFQRLFGTLHAQVMAEKRLRERSDGEIVDVMSQSAGEDLRGFFVGELGFHLDEDASSSPNRTEQGPRPQDRPSVDIPPLN